MSLLPSDSPIAPSTNLDNSTTVSFIPNDHTFEEDDTIDQDPSDRDSFDSEVEEDVPAGPRCHVKEYDRFMAHRFGCAKEENDQPFVLKMSHWSFMRERKRRTLVAARQRRIDQKDRARKAKVNEAYWLKYFEEATRRDLQAAAAAAERRQSMRSKRK